MYVLHLICFTLNREGERKDLVRFCSVCGTTEGVLKHEQFLVPELAVMSRATVYRVTPGSHAWSVLVYSTPDRRHF